LAQFFVADFIVATRRRKHGLDTSLLETKDKAPDG